MKVPSPKAITGSLLVASIMLALAGIGAFLWIFGRDFNIYWLILSPVIIALYELPAVYLLWLYRKRRAEAKRAEDRPADERDGDPGRP
jgi:hypothetical protein